MAEKLTQRLIDQAIAASRKHGRMNKRIHEAFEARYGVSFSDIDEDSLIDEFDYGIGCGVKLATCDRLMAEAGHPQTRNRT